MEITYFYKETPNQTDSAFYCSDHSWATLVVIKNGEREFEIGVNGEMRIHAPNDEVWRYTSDLLDAGIDTDGKLAEFSDANPDAWQNNNWFEITELNSDNEWWEVCDTIEEAIAWVKEILAEGQK